MDYVELQVTSNFSFLQGGSHPDELIGHAARLGYQAIAITDTNTLAGIVRAHAAARQHGIRLIVGCRLRLQDCPDLLVYPIDIEGYGRLTSLLSKGNLRTEKGSCELNKGDLKDLGDNVKVIVVAPAQLTEDFAFPTSFNTAVAELCSVFGRNLYLGATKTYLGEDAKRLFHLHQISISCNIPLVATNDVYYHDAGRRQLQDILTCIREKCTIHAAGFKLHPNAERYLKPAEEMQRLFMQYPQALENSGHIAAACQFSLDSLQYKYPQEITQHGRTPIQELTQLAWEGVSQRYGKQPPEKIVADVEKELAFIAKRELASYFLTVYDFVKFARSRGILCQGRGSAANSTVCYCLGITSVDPSKFSLLFERFMSDARNEPPDIDVDFEHERREEVIQYIYQKYGRDRAAIVATVTQVHQKGAIRDVGKAMGLSADIISKISSLVWHFSDEALSEKAFTELGLSAKDPFLRKVIELTNQYIGFPRQLGQHTGGFVIADDKLTTLCPILNARMENRTNLEWNKDDLDALGFVKVDVLALGMLTCIRKGFDQARQHYGLDLALHNIPQDDPAVYSMISRADTIGVFQIESRAQMSMLPRLQPQRFYDLVIEVAIVRPGPIQGNMVHPYLRRREGKEAVSYPSPELEAILSRTLGVPLFQEQAMQIAIVGAGFSAAEADQLRRSMATFKVKQGGVNKFEKMLIDGMMRNGYTEAYARQIYEQLKGFGSYGFPESHAASFALLVYISAWLKCHYPDVFACAILNSLPMGFYQPAQLVSDAQKHGVEVRPIDVNISGWDHCLEEQVGQYKALRLGFRMIKSIRKDEIDLVVAKRGDGYMTVAALRDAGVSQATIELLAEADGFRSIGMDRRRALWEATALSDRPIGMFQGQAAAEEPGIDLPEMALSEHVVQDYSKTSLSLKAHPVSFVLPKLRMLGVKTHDELEQVIDRAPVKVAGLVLVRQRPGTAKGVMFMTLEDPYGSINVVVFDQIFNRFRKEILQAAMLIVSGKMQKEGRVIHVVAEQIYNATSMLATLNNDNDPLTDKGQAAKKDKGHLAQQGNLFQQSRDFK